MVQTVDVRGLPCPQPVIETRKAMEQGDEVLTIVDSHTSQKNVSRMAEGSGWTVIADRRQDGIYLRISPTATAEAKAESARGVARSNGPLVLVVPSELMGRGDHTELGQVLIRAFFHTLGEIEPLPDVIVFFNSGVKLVVNDSPVAEDLESLVDAGVEILACGTCLGYYSMREDIAVGKVSNMYSIAETMLGAGRLVYL